MDDRHTIPIYKLSRLATRLVFQPKLQYLQTTIYLPNKNVVKVKSLVDSGCAKTAMSKALYLKINQLDPHVKLNSTKAQIQTCDGTTHGVEGIITLKVSIDKKTHIIFTINILVISGLADDFIIGSDILTSNLVEKSTPTQIHLKCPSTNDLVAETFEITKFPIQKVSPVQSTFHLLKGFKPNEHTVHQIDRKSVV